MSAAELDPQGCCSFMDIQRQQQRQNPGLQGAGCKKDAERIGEKEEKHSMRSEKVSTAPAPGCHQGSDTQAKGTLLLQYWWNFKAQQRNWELCQKTFISCVACWVFSADLLKALSLAWSLINFHSSHSEEGNQCQEPWGFHSMSLPVRWDLTVADSTAMALVTGTTNCQSWTLLQIPVPTEPIVRQTWTCVLKTQSSCSSAHLQPHDSNVWHLHAQALLLQALLSGFGTHLRFLMNSTCTARLFQSLARSTNAHHWDSTWHPWPYTDKTHGHF